MLMLVTVDTHLSIQVSHTIQLVRKQYFFKFKLQCYTGLSPCLLVELGGLGVPERLDPQMYLL